LKIWASNSFLKKMFTIKIATISKDLLCALHFIYEEMEVFKRPGKTPDRL
jgi:hypothetical protein